MIDIRKIVIVLVVAVLFAILVFTTIEAVYPRPQYDDFCKARPFKVEPFNPDRTDCTPINVPESQQQACIDRHGYVSYDYDSVGCPVSWYCETCQYEYEQENERYQRVVFYISAVLALIAIFIGLFLPAHQNPLNEWIGTGFMLGGAFALFFGTATAFTSLDRIARPIVIFIELAIVIFVAYRKIGSFRKR